MKMYVITKELTRCTWAITRPMIHEVVADIKTAKARVAELNRKAQSYHYEYVKANLYEKESE